MKDGNDIISGFESNIVRDGGPIDFSLAEKLERGGSTCDVYVTRHHRRRVFIKRLKEQFRTNTVYLAALDKEFDLGVGLNHKSLPKYREYYGDYIVMDFIDGVTLAEVINSDAGDETKSSAASRWLHRPANLRRMLKELIEVTGYLHRHNVVHCDIKPDNVILTDGTFNLMLIDLDKSYTSWLDDTSGSPAIYDVEPSRRGYTDIDFHGIGKIVEALIAAGFKSRGLNKLRARCFDDDVKADDLLRIVAAMESHPLRVAVPLIAAVGLILWLNSDGKVDQSHIASLQTQPPVDTVETVAAIDTVPLPPPDPTPIPPVAKKLPPKPKVDIEKLLSSMFSPLYEELDRLESLITDTTLTSDEIYDSMINYLEIEKDCHGKAYAAVNEARNNIDPFDGPKEVWQTKACAAYMHYSDSIQRRVSNEWRARIPKK